MAAPGARNIALLTVALLLGLAAPGSARAQVSASATVESSYRFRGMALTNGRPDLRVGVAYDHRSGAYGGASVIAGEDAGGDIRLLGYIGHLGYARRTASGLTWDIGATRSSIVDTIPVTVTIRPPQNFAYTQTILYRYRATYSEIYGGLSKGNFSTRLYVSPDYLGEGMRTAYLDVNAAIKPAKRVRLFGHAGVLAPLTGPAGRSLRPRYDLRAGVALEFSFGEVQASWAAVTSRVEYPIGYPQKRQALVVSATTFF